MPDGRRALSASFDGTVRLWNVETGAELRRFNRQGEQLVDVAVSPDGKWVAVGSMKGTLRLWRLLE
jgi:WD40 repeat protein